MSLTRGITGQCHERCSSGQGMEEFLWALIDFMSSKHVMIGMLLQQKGISIPVAHLPN